MENDVFMLSVHRLRVTVVTIKGILVKLPMENLLGDFTQKGGISSLSSLFRAGGAAFMARDCRDVLRELDTTGRMQHGK